MGYICLPLSNQFCHAVRSTYPLSMSVGLQPKIYVSNVTTRAVKPAAFALDKIDTVMSSFSGQYNRNHLTPSLLAAATSSMLVLLAVLMIYGTCSAAAADVEAISPSGLKILWTPTGATAIGDGSRMPMCLSSTERSGNPEVLIKRLGMIDHFLKASWFFSVVSNVPAFPDT